VEIGNALLRRAGGPPRPRTRVLADADAEAASLELGDSPLEASRHT
jgi:hypothetical protein